MNCFRFIILKIISVKIVMNEKDWEKVLASFERFRPETFFSIKKIAF